MPKSSIYGVGNNLFNQLTNHPESNTTESCCQLWENYHEFIGCYANWESSFAWTDSEIHVKGFVSSFLRKPFQKYSCNDNDEDLETIRKNANQPSEIVMNIQSTNINGIVKMRFCSKTQTLIILDQSGNIWSLYNNHKANNSPPNCQQEENEKGETNVNTSIHTRHPPKRPKLDSPSSNNMDAASKTRNKKSNYNYSAKTIFKFIDLVRPNCYSFEMTDKSLVLIDNNSRYLYRINRLNLNSQQQEEQEELILEKRVRKLTAGTFHYLCLTENEGTVYSWGDAGGLHGQLGHGCMEPESKETKTPRPIEALEGIQVTDIAAGGNFSVIVIEDDVYTFGSNKYNQLGSKMDETWDAATPTLIYHQLTTPDDESNSNESFRINVSCGPNYLILYNDKGYIQIIGQFLIDNKDAFNIKDLLKDKQIDDSCKLNSLSLSYHALFLIEIPLNKNQIKVNL